MDTKEKVFVMNPHPGVITTALHDSLLRLVTWDSGKRRVVDAVQGYKGLYVHCGRNILARNFLKSDCTWQLAVDSDIEFRPEVLYQLLDAADADKRPIVSACYFTFIGEEDALRPCWFERNERGDYRIIRDFDGGLQKLDAIGMGCVLIHRSVYETIAKSYPEPKPWFDHEVITMADGKQIEMGEDFTFSMRATKCGIPIWGHGAAQVDHWKTMRLNIKLFERLERNHALPEPEYEKLVRGEAGGKSAA